MKVLGWIFMPYIMILIHWRKLTPTKRYIALGYIALIIVSGIINGSLEDQRPLASSAPTSQESKTLTPAQPASKPAESAGVSPVQTTTNPATTEIKPAAVQQEVTLDLKTKTKEIVEGVNPDSYDTVLHFPGDIYPETAAHIISAIKKGKSAVCILCRHMYKILFL